MQELASLDAIAQAELCALGEVTAGELWHAAISRIERLNPLLRAVVLTAERPPAAVRAGPLGGVPLLVKDSLPWPGWAWTLGSRVFASRVTQQQTDYGRRLVEAGLCCVGKTALSEFGLLASTESLLFGATHNPWDLSRSPFGSSGGSAVAVAAGLVPIAQANDGGGSIRVPASACGVFGFKPTRGRTALASRSASDFSELTSEHCMSRSVRDSALFLSLTEEPGNSAPVGFVREPLRRSLKIGAWTSTLGGGAPEPSVLAAHQRNVALLSALGHRVEQISGPRFALDELSEALYLVAAAAIAGVVETLDRTRPEPVQEHELEPFSWELIELLERHGAQALPRAREALRSAALSYREATQAYDVVLTPASADEPPPLGYLSPILPARTLLNRTQRALGYTPIQNIVGAPAMSVPLQWSESGLPLGAHFAAAPGEDALLLALAYQLEAAAPWHDRWPPYSIPALASARR